MSADRHTNIVIFCLRDSVTEINNTMTNEFYFLLELIKPKTKEELTVFYTICFSPHGIYGHAELLMGEDSVKESVLFEGAVNVPLDC